MLIRGLVHGDAGYRRAGGEFRADVSAGVSPRSTGTTTTTGSVTVAAVGDMILGKTPDLPPDSQAYLDSVKSVLSSGAHPLQLSSQGLPSPGGDATGFVAQLSRSDFGPSAARISALGVIQH